MALSGTIYNNFATGYRIQIEWSATQNIENNTSTITANFYLMSLGSSYEIHSSTKKTVRITIDGTTYTSANQTAALSGNQKKLMATATKTVTHNADGTKTFSLSGSIDLEVTLSGKYYGTVSVGPQSFTLDPIPRASQPTLSASQVEYGQSVTIYTNRASSSFTHTLRYNWNGHTGTIATGVGTSYTWTVPLSFMNYIPNATSTTGTIYCDTYSGGKLIGTKSVTLKTVVPASVVPTFDTITHSEAVPDVATKVGQYVKGLSKLNIAITGAAGAYGSTITAYKIEFDGKTYNSQSVTTSVISQSGTLTIKGTVTDSRGRSYSKTVSITVLDYSPPQITGVTVRRCNSDGTPNDLGEYASVSRSVTISTLGGKNTATVYVESAPRGSGAWTTKHTQNITGNISGTVVIGTYSVTQSFDIRVRVVDQFTTSTATSTLSTGVVTMSWAQQGVGIRKVWERGALDVNGMIYTNAGITVTNPNDSNANVVLDWLNNKPRIRYGGSGAGSSGPFEIQAPGDVVVASFSTSKAFLPVYTQVGGVVQITGKGAPTSGAGLELEGDATGSEIMSINRGTGAVTPLVIRGSEIQLQYNTETKLLINNEGVIAYGSLRFPGITNPGVNAPRRSYPFGISWHVVSGDSSWPGSYGHVITFNLSSTRGTQFFFSNGSPPTVYCRVVDPNGNWTAWRQIHT